MAIKKYWERRAKARGGKNWGAALGVLDDRERRVFVARYLADMPNTLQELADEFGVSRQRMCQIEARAFKKIQAARGDTTRGRRATQEDHG
jgi:RNA polymerase sigma-32 factor